MRIPVEKPKLPLFSIIVGYQVKIVKNIKDCRPVNTAINILRPLMREPEFSIFASFFSPVFCTFKNGRKNKEAPIGNMITDRNAILQLATIASIGSITAAVKALAHINEEEYNPMRKPQKSG